MDNINGMRKLFIAEQGTILRTLVGSGVHGVSVSGQDDRDEMGICIEPADCVIGLSNFEHYSFRTQPEGVRSHPGDLDLVIYSLRKWMALALKGNPSILIPLFAPQQHVYVENYVGKYLRAHPELVVSKLAGARFLGYMQSQKRRLMGEEGQGKMPKRPELVEEYGFDTKYAYHILRLGLQGAQLMDIGSIVLPMPTHCIDLLLGVRTGKYSFGEVLGLIATVESNLQSAIAHSRLPDRPDYTRANSFLVSAYTEAWLNRPSQALREGLHV